MHLIKHDKPGAERPIKATPAPESTEDFDAGEALKEIDALMSPAKEAKKPSRRGLKIAGLGAAALTVVGLAAGLLTGGGNNKRSESRPAATSHGQALPETPVSTQTNVTTPESPNTSPLPTTPPVSAPAAEKGFNLNVNLCNSDAVNNAVSQAIGATSTLYCNPDMEIGNFPFNANSFEFRDQPFGTDSGSDVVINVIDPGNNYPSNPADELANEGAPSGSVLPEQSIGGFVCALDDDAGKFLCLKPNKAGVLVLMPQENPTDTTNYTSIESAVMGAIKE